MKAKPRKSIKTGVLTVTMAGASALTFASADYGPAIWNPVCSGHWYTSGYGHKFHVMHDIEGYYMSTISYFKNCNTQASIHYIVNGKKDTSTDAPAGEITQMVAEAYYAWHARCWNQHSTGTEHEGFASNPAWYTDAMYQTSGDCVRHIADKFGWAKDRNHVVGHGEKSNAAWVSWARGNLGIDPICNTHTDPGPYWNWNYCISLVKYVLTGAIRDHYNALGGMNSGLGNPTISETGTPDGVGRYNHFDAGASIYWTPNWGAWSVRGAIRDKWAALGWENGPVGYPVTDETGTPDGVGRFNHFKRLSDGEDGSIYWTPNYGAWSIHGSIRAHWAALGWENGIGYPITDETGTPDGIGRYNHFKKLNGAEASIYYSPSTGAWSVQGAIRDKWASMGWENSCLGYPTSDEYDWNGQRRNDFQNGYITWDSVNGAVASCGAPPPPPPPLVDVTVDNSSAGFSVVGTAWATGSSATDKYGSDYRYRSTAAVSEPAQWAASLSATANYVISAWWPQGANRSASAPYVVYHASGSTTVNVNQQINGGRWNALGTFGLNGGNNTVKLSCWTATGYVVMADAIRWQQQ